MKYKLEKYKSVANRYTCPACGRKRCFTRYVCIESGRYVYDTVGKCDHVQSCGYHYTPSQFYRDNPWEDEIHNPKNVMQPYMRPAPKPAPCYIDQDYIGKYMSNGSDNLLRWLSSLFGSDKVDAVRQKYRIGTTALGKFREQGVIFWQIDRFGSIHDGKIMWYNSGGHRQRYMTWVSSKLKSAGLFPDQDTEKCLFGEHLLMGDDECPIGLVESEKSAVVLACIYPQLTWLATCGCGGLNADKVRPLLNHKVFVFPDAGESVKWDGILRGTRLDYDINPIDNYPPNTDIVDIIIDKTKPIHGEEFSITHIINNLTPKNNENRT